MPLLTRFLCRCSSTLKNLVQTRDREIALWDPRRFDKPLTKQILDTNTGVLMPLVDQARKMIYLVGRVSFSYIYV